MKKNLLSLILVFLAHGTAWGWNDQPASKWLKMPHEIQVVYIAAFLSGFQAGFATGGNMDDIRFSLKTTDYVRELQTFYSVHPHCLSGALDNVLIYLAIEWSKNKREFSEAAVQNCKEK